MQISRDNGALLCKPTKQLCDLHIELLLWQCDKPLLKTHTCAGAAYFRYTSIAPFAHMSYYYRLHSFRETAAAADKGKRVSLKSRLGARLALNNKWMLCVCHSFNAVSGAFSSSETDLAAQWRSNFTFCILTLDEYLSAAAPTVKVCLHSFWFTALARGFIIARIHQFESLALIGNRMRSLTLGNTL